MIHGFRSPEKLVYHYTSAATALNHILANNTLRLSPYADTNDPRETKSWEFNLATTGQHDLGQYPFQETSVTFSAMLKENAKLVCFSTDTTPLTGDPVSDILSRGFAKPRMWAQYGGNHTGVCLVFDRASLLACVRSHASSQLLLAGSVNYRNRLVSRSLTWHEFVIDMARWESLGPAEYARLHTQIHHKALFFEKLLDWRDEQEWRIVLLADKPGFEFVNLANALVGVIHGANIDIDMSVRIAEITDGAKVKHMGLTWKNSTPWYHYEAMRWSSVDRKSPWAKHAR